MTMRALRALPTLAAINGLLAIVVGAFATHALTDPQAKSWAATAALYQMSHAAAVFALLGWRNSVAVRRAAWALTLGTLLFGLSLDALALGAPRGASLAAPIGGTLMILGWLAVIWTAAGGRD
jgi:uncharacterized membrane protein YgdD (TMEM256/DUF423 family)